MVHLCLLFKNSDLGQSLSKGAIYGHSWARALNSNFELTCCLTSLPDSPSDQPLPYHIPQRTSLSAGTQEYCDFASAAIWPWPWANSEGPGKTSSDVFKTSGKEKEKQTGDFILLYFFPSLNIQEIAWTITHTAHVPMKIIVQLPFKVLKSRYLKTFSGMKCLVTSESLMLFSAMDQRLKFLPSTW